MVKGHSQWWGWGVPGRQMLNSASKLIKAQNPKDSESEGGRGLGEVSARSLQSPPS